MPVIRNNGSPIGNLSFSIQSGESVIDDELWERASKEAAVVAKIEAHQVQVIGPHPSKSDSVQKFLQKVDSGVWTRALFRGVALKHPDRSAFVLVAANVELLTPDAPVPDLPQITTPRVLRRSALVSDASVLKHSLKSFLSSTSPIHFGAFDGKDLEWPASALGMAWNHERTNERRVELRPGCVLRRIAASEKGRLGHYLGVEGIQSIDEEVQQTCGLAGLHEVVRAIGIDESNFRGGTGFTSSAVVAELPITFKASALPSVPPTAARIRLELAGTSSVDPAEFTASVLRYPQHANLRFDDGEGVTVHGDQARTWPA